MQQINNNFQEYYYLTKDGKVYNSKTKRYIKIDAKHSFKLKKKDNTYSKISLKSLYKLVYKENYCNDSIESFEGEVWKPIDRTNNIYWISNKGRVKSLYGYNAIILKPNYVKGYSRVDIVQDGSRYSKLISRLVAAAFLLPPEEIDMQLHHIDGNKQNNNSDNLIWLTIAEHKKMHRELNKRKEELYNAMER